MYRIRSKFSVFALTLLVWESNGSGRKTLPVVQKIIGLAGEKILTFPSSSNRKKLALFYRILSSFDEYLFDEC